MSKRTKSCRSGKAGNGKPHPDFPLWRHTGSGQWCKKVRGRFHYFGRIADDPEGEGALHEWLRVKDDLLAGREPRPAGDGAMVTDLCNHWLTQKRQLLQCGELTRRTFDFK